VGRKILGEIKRGEAIPKMEKQPITLTEQKNCIMRIILPSCLSSLTVAFGF
jgi:hypothetical protein